MTGSIWIYSFYVTLRFFREQSPTLSWAFCFLQFIEPRHSPGLFRFRLHHTRCYGRECCWG
nr:MAG TPA: hypothetical protein [Caudoviricetes sp.]